jgi:uncharacterized tellurite resistance protein B-like protein
MLKAIAQFFDNHFASNAENDQVLTVDQLQLAAATLMIELCKADRDIDERETSTIIEILQTCFDLDKSELNELMALAEQEAREATSLYQFTSLMNEQFDYGEKVQLITHMWDVAYADGHIDRYEDHLIRKVSDLLYISHVDFIGSKHKARERAGQK